MQEIARVILENEMDLILAHKRAMKLAELAGLPISSQTTFATAVSEVSRNAIGTGKKSYLSLNVENEGRYEKFIVARLKNDVGSGTEGIEYAKRLVDKYNISNKGTLIELFFAIHPHTKTDVEVLDEWRRIFRNEPPISPYDELKRKNDQLLELSERIQQSEAKYKSLTNSLPLIIFSLDTEGQFTFANEWLEKYAGETVESLNENKWKNIIHADDYTAFSLLLQNDGTQAVTALKTQLRLKHAANGEYLWHQVFLQPVLDENRRVQNWNGFFADIHAQKVYEETLKDNIELKEVQEQLRANQAILETYIQELNRSNRELQQFAYIASHDLQEPIRKILFYSDYLHTKYHSMMDDKAKAFVEKIHTSSLRMRTLVQDILFFAQTGKDKIHFKEVNLNDVIKEVFQELEVSIEEKKASISVDELPVITGDKSMLLQLFENILSNALKFTRKNVSPVITIRVNSNPDYHVIDVKDNGIGFEQEYLPKMFTLFQRLHSRGDYEGTGLGLAICKKVTDLHGGQITASSIEMKGATFSISLPKIISKQTNP